MKISLQKNVTMSKKITLLVFLFCASLTLLISNPANLEKQESSEAKKIALREQTKGTRSSTSVDAIFDSRTVTVFVEDYTGNVSVSIFGVGGMLASSFYCDNTGQNTMDISSCREGLYTIQIEVGSKTYEGYFEKI